MNNYSCSVLPYHETVFEADKLCLLIIRDEGPVYGMVSVLTGFIDFFIE
jgi:hypothetical protein